MCGIIGIITNKERNIIPELISSLRNLEYRGYDSTGIALVDGDEIKRLRRTGAPSEVLHTEEIVKELGIKGKVFSVGIGHNRWATHGKPSERNAHPHIDCSGTIALVHNGTILNYEVLRKELQDKNHVFTSDTDTEVIAHLIEENIKKGSDLQDAFLVSINQLEGSFGLVVCSAKEPSHMYIAKNGSPLSFGISKNSLIVASSTNAILPHTNTFITLEDGEYAELSIDSHGVGYRIGNFVDNRQNITKETITIKDFSPAELSKGEYESFMEKEVYEQPATFRTTILGRFDEKTGDAILGGLIDYKNVLLHTKGIVTIACGTAHNASLVGAVLIECLAGILVRNEIASEFRYKKIPHSPENTIVIVVSQSGETADTLGSVKEARSKGYKTFGIVKVVGSSIAEAVDAGVYTRAGTEIGVASTKSFTAQLAVFYLLALKLARERGMTAGEGRAYLSILEKIPELMQKTLFATKNVVKRYADYYVKKQISTINFLGRGINVPLGQEASLKFKELTYMEAGSYPLGELKHGPIAVIDSNALSVIIMPRDELFALNKSSLEQILSKDGNVIVVTDEASAHEIQNKNIDIITIPTLSNPLFYPLLEILPLQLFAYYYAFALGNNVDKPRNLAKSVTVE
jgi:glucosamine--fructose-6-phosphate aminotransferase (isomerizing)